MGYTIKILFYLLLVSVSSFLAKEIFYDNGENHDQVSSISRTLNFKEVGIKVVLPKQQDTPNTASDDGYTDLRFKINISHGAVLLETKSINIPYLAWGLFFKKGLQVFKSIMFGEEDLKEISYDSMCFIDLIDEKEIADLGSLEKVFQIGKEPQVAEIVLDKQHVSVDLKFVKYDFKHFGKEIGYLCSTAQHIYTTSKTIDQLAKGDKDLKTELMSSMKLQATRNANSYPLCEEAVSMWDLGCLCKRLHCIPWYPCGLKYCSESNKDENSKVICGLLTCKKCREYEFYVDKKDLCFWNIKNN